MLPVIEQTNQATMQVEYKYAEDLMNACSHTEVTPKYQKICGDVFSTAVPRCRVLRGSKNGVNSPSVSHISKLVGKCHEVLHTTFHTLTQHSAG